MVSSEATLLKQRRDLALGIGPEAKIKKLNEFEDLSLDRYVFNPNFDLKLDDRITEMSSAVRNDAGEPILPRGCLGRVVTEYRPAMVGGISDLNPPQMKKLPIPAGHIAQGLERVYGKLGIQEILECKGFQKGLTGEMQDIICPDIPDDNYTWLEMLEPVFMRDWIKQQSARIADLAHTYDVGDLYERTLKAAERMRKCLVQNLAYVNDYVAMEVASIQKGRAGVPGAKTVLDTVDQKFFKLLGKSVPEQFLTFDPKDDQGTLVTAVSAGVAEAMKAQQPQGGASMDMSQMAAAFAEALRSLGLGAQQAPKPAEDKNQNKK